MTSSNDLGTLLKTLSARTLADRASWSRGSSDHTFIWSGTSASVVLSSTDQDGVSPYTVRLVDKDERMIEEVQIGPASDPEMLELLTGLYAVARERADRLDGTIAGLMGDLGE